MIQIKALVLTIVGLAGLCPLAASATDSNNATSVSAAVSFSGVATDKEGNVYVVDSINFAIHKYGSNGRLICDIAIPFLDAPLPPNPIAVDKGDGTVYFGGTLYSGEGRLFKAKLEGARYNVEPFFPSMKSRPTGLAVDKHGNVYVAAFDYKKILKLDPKTNVSSTVANVSLPMAVAVDASDTVYFADIYSDSPGKLFKATLQAGSYKVEAIKNTGLETPINVALDDNGNIYVVDDWNHTIRKFNSDGKEQILKAGPDNPNLNNSPLAIALDGNKLYFTTRHVVFRTEANCSPLLVSSKTFSNIAVDWDRNPITKRKGVYLTGESTLFEYDQEKNEIKERISNPDNGPYSGVAVSRSDGCVMYNTMGDTSIDNENPDAKKLTMAAYPPKYAPAQHMSWTKLRNARLVAIDAQGVSFFAAWNTDEESWDVLKTGDVVKGLLNDVMIDLKGIRGLAVDTYRNVYASFWSEKGGGVAKATWNYQLYYTEDRGFISGVKDPRAIAVTVFGDGTSNVYLIDGQTVCKYNEKGEFISYVASGVENARDIAVDGSDRVYILCSQDGKSSTIWKIQPGLQVFAK